MTFRKILWGLLTVGCGVLLVLAAIGYNMEYDWVRIFEIGRASCRERV